MGAASGSPVHDRPLTLPQIVALALATGDQRDGVGYTIPQETWDWLHENGLVETRRDVTGEGYTNTTAKGIGALLFVLDAEVGR